MEVPIKVEQAALPGFNNEAQPAPGFRYTHGGKEVHCCGEHYADAVSSEAATSITAAMNAADLQQDWARLISQVK